MKPRESDGLSILNGTHGKIINSVCEYIITLFEDGLDL